MRLSGRLWRVEELLWAAVEGDGACAGQELAMLLLRVGPAGWVGGGGQSEAGVLGRRTATTAASDVGLDRVAVVGLGAQRLVEVGLVVQAELSRRPRWSELGRAVWQAEVREDFSHRAT